jgi:phosphopantetheine--protein transferase-like protein
VGNDIVDLADPENIGKSADERFCRRVFNAEELSMIAGSDRPDSFLWMIWAAKEAAYKAISRMYPVVCSIPRRYPVVLETAAHAGSVTPLKGKVRTPLGDVSVHVFIEVQALHAIAFLNVEDLTGIVFRVERVDVKGGDPSGFVRKILLEEIASRLGCPVGSLSVFKEKKRPWAPFISFREGRLPIEISLSHDGRFVAFAYDSGTLHVSS